MQKIGQNAKISKTFIYIQLKLEVQGRWLVENFFIHRIYKIADKFCKF